MIRIYSPVLSFLYKVFSLVYIWQRLSANNEMSFIDLKEKILAIFTGTFLSVFFGRGSIPNASDNEMKSVFRSYDEVGSRGISSVSYTHLDVYKRQE